MMVNGRKKGREQETKEKPFALSPSTSVDMFYLPIFSPSYVQRQASVNTHWARYGNFIAKANIFSNFSWLLLSLESFLSNKF